MDTLLTGADIFTGSYVLSGYGLLIRSGIIDSLIKEDESPPDVQEHTFPMGTLLAPGLVDVQVNGAGGVLFNDHPDTSSAEHIAKTMRHFGVTSVMPTLITSSKDALHTAVEAIQAALEDPYSSIIGLHVEGPFISPEKRGCHPLDYIRLPKEDDIAFLEHTSRTFRHMGGRLMLTAAPEHMPTVFTHRLRDSGVILSAGHSLATYEDMQEACANGFSGITHLGNAMTPLSGREPGIFGAALTSTETLWAGIIADGQHLHPSLMRLVLDSPQRGGGQPFLVSDAMPTVGSTQNSFRLFDTQVHKKEQGLYTDDGTLAGAHTHLAACLRNLLRITTTNREEGLRMASLYPSCFVGLDHKIGKLEPGRHANLVAFNGRMRVVGTWVRGIFSETEDVPPSIESTALENEKI